MSVYVEYSAERCMLKVQVTVPGKSFRCGYSRNQVLHLHRTGALDADHVQPDFPGGDWP